MGLMPPGDLNCFVGSPPRAPAYANSEVASYYVQYNRGPLRGFLLLFAALFFFFAAVAAFGWKQWADAWISTMVGLALLILGIWSYLAMPSGV